MSKSLTPLKTEILALEKQLATDQKQWQQQKSKLVREVNTLEAKLPALREQFSELTVKIEAATNHLDSLKTDIRDRDVERIEAEKALQEAQTAAQEAGDKLVDIEKQIATKKAGIDQEIADYREHCQVEADNELSTVRKKLKDAKTELAEARSETAEAREDLNEINNSIQKRKDGIDQELVDKQAELDTLNSTIVDKQAEADDLKEQVKLLSRQKVQALAALAKAEDQHNKFVKYEAEARKVLDALDKSLTAKQADLNDQERFIRARRSNLPSM